MLNVPKAEDLKETVKSKLEILEGVKDYNCRVTIEVLIENIIKDPHLNKMPIYLPQLTHTVKKELEALGYKVNSIGDEAWEINWQG